MFSVSEKTKGDVIRKIKEAGYDKESHTWSEIKDYLIKSLPVEESSEITASIDSFCKRKQRYAPKDTNYYTVYYRVYRKELKISLRRDIEKSPVIKTMTDIYKETYYKLERYLRESHSWKRLKAYIRETLTAEQASIIINSIELSSKGVKSKYAPLEKEGVYYYMYWNVPKNKYSVKKDKEHSWGDVSI